MDERGDFYMVMHGLLYEYTHTFITLNGVREDDKSSKMLDFGASWVCVVNSQMALNDFLGFCMKRICRMGVRNCELEQIVNGWGRNVLRLPLSLAHMFQNLSFRTTEFSVRTLAHIGAVFWEFQGHLKVWQSESTSAVWSICLLFCCTPLLPNIRNH